MNDGAAHVEQDFFRTSDSDPSNEEVQIKWSLLK